ANTFGSILAVGGNIENHGLFKAESLATLRITSDSWVNEGILSAGPWHPRILGGIEIHATSFRNSKKGTITGEGRLTLSDTTLENEGIISPGDAIGELVVDGDLTMKSTSTLRIDVAGSSGAESDLLTVFGDTQLGGLLELSLASSFELAGKQPFDILRVQSGGLTGQFANAPEFVVVRSALFAVTYSENSVSLTPVRIPEPSTKALFLLTVVCGCWLMKTR
ncbi:MAG: hypothetical protein ACR2NU_14130, partial [Aeoliella sp.]